MRLALLALILAGFVLASVPARAFGEAELIDGFERVVFGSEYPTFGWQAYRVKKFAAPVRVHVDDRSADRRGEDVIRFLRSLPELIRGLDLRVADDASGANYRVFVVDRAAYRDVVAREVYGRAASSFAPGRCLVRVIATRAGISRADAVIVADEGDYLFRRCMVEEILQGLGPVNDDRALAESVFNDRSRHSTFTRFDRCLLNMLYHPLVRPGMSRRQVQRVLPDVAADVLSRRC